MDDAENLNARGGVDDDFAKTAMAQFFDLYFIPEMKRRLDANLITSDFDLRLAQVLFDEEKIIEIRLNSEVRGQLLVHPNREAAAGTPVTEEDFRGFRGFDLEQGERDYGHITVFRVGSGWIGSFNALRGRNQVSLLLDRAHRYLDAAFDAEIKQHFDVATDTLFSACELMSKCTLMLFMQNGKDSKSHKSTSSSINVWNKLGNIDPAFVDLFNKLSNTRESARYNVVVARPVTLPTNAIKIAAEQLVRIRALCRDRTEITESESLGEQQTS